MTAQDYYRQFTDDRRDILRSFGPADMREPNDWDAADQEAFEAVVGPLIEARAKDNS